MDLLHDSEARWLAGVVVAILVVSSLVGWALQRTLTGEKAGEVVRNLNARIRAWWIMFAVFCAAMATGGIGSAVLFGLMSWLALREFITLTPTKRADHRALFWMFFILTPLNYFLVAIHWYGLFSVFIPVYGFLLIPIRNVLAADCDDFLARTAKIQWALMICVYFVSYAPALLALPIPGYEGENGKLLFYFVLIVQMSDVLQYVFGKLLGRRKIAPSVSPNKTVEGFAGGVAGAVLLGTCLWWLTPFTAAQAAAMSFLIAIMGFCGGLVMSAIKRDRGVKDYGAILPGHGGMLDRIDSLCFAAPAFFHATRYFFT